MLREERASPIDLQRGIHIGGTELRGYSAGSDGRTDQADCLAFDHGLIVSGVGAIKTVRSEIGTGAFSWPDGTGTFRVSWPVKGSGRSPKLGTQVDGESNP
jgi:hypothetical protein